MKRFGILLTLVLVSLMGYSQEKKTPQPFIIDGYIQVRGATNYQSNPNFYLRRIKIWMKNTPQNKPYGDFLYKIKIFFTKGNKLPTLFDAQVGYKYKNFSIWMGQQVIDFGRQITLGDAKIYMGERARLNYYLSPGAESVLRDIGLQAFYHFNNKRGHISFGYFNGYFANTYMDYNKCFMFNHRLSYNIINHKKNYLNFQYSLSYRKADSLYFKKLIGSIPFSGTDIRTEIAMEARYGIMFLEAAYNKAWLLSETNNYIADGFYAFLNTFVTPKDVVILAVDNLNTPLMPNSTMYGIGYSHLFNGHRTKLTINHWITPANNQLSHYTFVQMQIFLKTN